MASDIEQRNFVDKDGLEQFWDDIQAYMTRMYKGLPAGMQFSRIYQQNGQLHILVEPFGGDTLARKEASRNSLGVYSKTEIDANYKTKQDGVSEQFTEYQTLLEISQDTNGEISVRKQAIPTATVETLGLTTLKGVVSADDGDNSNAATPKAVADAITAAIEGLDVAELEIGQAKTVGTIEEVDGKIVVTAVPILVDTANIADNAVTSAKIADGTIQSGDIGAGQIKTTNIEDAAVTGTKIASETITSANIQNGTIQSDDIGIGQVHTTNIANSAVTTEKIANDSVTTEKILNGAVTTNKIANDAVTNDKVADNAIDTKQLVNGAVTNDKIGHDAVDGDKIADGAVDNEHIAADAVHETQILDGSVTRNKIANDAVNGDKIADDAIDNEHIAADAVHTEQIQDGSVTNAKITDGAVDYTKVTDTEGHPFAINISGNAATATNVQPGGELAQRIDDIENGKADKVNNAVSGNFAGLDEHGNLTDSGHKHSDYKTKQTAVADPTVPQSGTTTSLSFIDTISQDENGVITPTKKTLPKSDAINLDSSDTLATSAAVKAAVTASHSEITNLDFANILNDGEYITALSQTDGKINYTVGDMVDDDAIHPAPQGKEPVTSGALYKEAHRRQEEDDKINQLIPSAASHLNQLADKAYVDAIGERLEARYLGSSASMLPFDTKADFVLAAESNTFYYDGHVTTADNNDVVVITHDESKHAESSTGVDPTTRYRYIAHKIPVIDPETGEQEVDDKGNPVWETDENGQIIWEGQWYFEYIINNSALSEAQLLAINSGITETKRNNYDAHLANLNNPHQVSLAQLVGNEGKVSQAELEVLDGVAISTAELNTLQGMNTENPNAHTVQYQLNEKIDRIGPASDAAGYHVQNKIPIINDQDVVNGRFGLKDSGAIITHYYTPGDQLNPATGSAIHQALEAIEGTHNSTGSKLSITVDTDQHGIIDSVTIDDSGLATAAQGAKADSAVQTVTLNGTELSGNAIDLGNLKTTQTAVTDPSSSGNTQTYEFISTISQDTNGVITATKNLIPDANTNSTKGVVTLAGSIGATVSEENGKAATEKAVRDAINDLNVDDIEGFGAGKTLATLEENNGKISATFQDIAITKSQVTDFSHSHGNITNAGTIGSDSNKVLVTTTDGAIVAGDIEGTYSGNNPIATKSTVDDAIADLDSPDSVAENQFVTAVSETDGIIAVTKARPTIGNVNGLTERLEGIDNSLSALDSNKADKVTGATNGNLAGLDSNGNLTDSGYHVVDTYKVSDDKSAYLANPVTGTAVDAAIYESASSDRQYVDDKIDALDAELTSNDGTNVQFKVTEVDGKITAVNVTTDNTVNANDVDNQIDNKIADLDAEETSIDGTNVQFKVTEVDGVVTAVNVVTDNTVNATDVDTKVATEIGKLDAEETSTDGTNVQFKVTEVDGKITAVNVTTDNTVNANDVDTKVTTEIGKLDAEETSTDGTNVQFKVTEVDGKITAVNVTTDNTVNATDVANKVATEIGKLDVDDIIGFGADKTLETLTETDGKIAATFQSILVDTANIKPDAVKTAQIADDAVTSDKIKEGEVKTANIDDSAVTTAKINDSAVTTAKINDGAVTTDKIYDAAVTSEKIGEGEVKTINIDDEAVTTAKIDDEAVTTAKIADDAVTNDKIADNAVDTAQIKADAVTTAKINDFAVTTDKIDAGAATTAKIADDAVTNDKIADNAVDTAQIKADAVTTAKIADDAVTNDKIANNAVDTAQINDGAVTYDKVTNDPANPFPIDISGNATHADDASHADVADDVSEGSALDQRLDIIEENISDLDSTKADKVTGATEGNFAGLDANGNLTDSGHKHSDYKTKQSAVTKTGAVVKTLTSLTQNANGEIDATFSDIQSATTGQKGVVQLAGSIGATVASENNKAASEKAVRDAIDGVVDGLDAEVTSSDGTNVQVKVTEVDGKITAVNITTDETEDKNNKVTSWSATITDAHYPSEKLVKGALDEKADKVDNATDGNFAGLDANGNLTDSGHKHSDYKTKQEAVADPTVSGSTLVAIDSISQDTNGVVTATKKNIQSATIEQKGVVQLAGSIGATVASENNKAASEKAVRDAINALDVSDITANLGVGKTITALSESDGKISATASDIQITESQVTGLTTDLASKEDLSNKVTSWSATTTDAHYPSEKLVKDSLDTKVDKTTKVNGHALSSDVTVTKGDVGLGNVVNTGDSDTPVENGTTKFTTGGAYTELNKKADKTATVSNVAYDGTNKKITKTINGTTSDVVTAATLKADMALDNVANTNITVSATDGVTDNTNNVTYKYTHPTFTEKTAAAKKVGMNAEGHVVLGDALVKADVGLGNVENTSITISATDGVKDNTNNVTYKYVHPNGAQSATAAAAVKVGVDATGHAILGTAITKSDVGLGLVQNQTITVTNTSVSDGTHTFNKYTHPTYTAATAAAVKVGNDGTGHVVLGAALTKSDVGLGNVTNDAQVKRSEMGVANGVATLDNDGKVPAAQLPSYIDDVIEGYYYDGTFYEDSAYTVEIPPESGKVYVDKTTNLTYRWSGTAYVKIASDLALGETESTAYRGDRGKAAYDHSQLTSGNPHNVTKTDVGLGNVVNTGDSATPVSGGTTKFTTGGAYTELNKKADKTATVSNVAWDATNKKLTETINGTTSDVVTASTIKTALGLTKSDVGLGNVDNTSDDTKKTNFTGAVASGNTGFPTGDMVYQAIADGKECVVIAYGTPYSEVAAIVNADKFPVLKFSGMYFPLTMIVGGGDTAAYWFYSTRLGDPENYHTSVTIMKYVCKNANPAWSSTSNTYLQNNSELVSSWSTTVSNSRYPSEKLVKTSLDKKVDKVDGMGLSSNDYTTEEQTKLAGIADGAEVNQNAFSNVKVGSTTVAADSKTDTLELVAGSNVTITPDATNDKITIAATDTTYESKAAASGGTDVSLVTTGEKYTWNSKQNALATQTAYTSKGSATKVPQITTNSLGQVTGITEVTISGVTPAAHDHGNITNAGALQTTDIAIASGDKLVITDSSDSNKVARASAVFDGSTTTKALTQKGTFENFAKQADIDEAIEEIPTISLVGDNHITVTSDDTTGTVTVATDIAAQTAYIAKGSATKVPQITTNSLGQVTGITEVTITGVTPAAHTHGNITNDGKVGSNADYAVVTTTGGLVTTESHAVTSPSTSGNTLEFIDTVSQNSKGKISATKKKVTISDTYSSTGTDPVSGKAVAAAIGTLDVSNITANLGVGKTITALSESDGKISATASNIQITESQVTSLTTDLGHKEDKSNKVSSWSSTTNTTRYPSEKLVKDSLDAKENISNKVTSWQSTPDNTHYPSEKLVNDALNGKIPGTTLSVNIPASSTRYIKMTVTEAFHHYIVMLNAMVGSDHAEWMFRTYGTGGNSGRTVVNYIGAPVAERKWFVAGATGQTYYIEYINTATAAMAIKFSVCSIDNSALPTLEVVDTVPSDYGRVPIYGTVAQRLTNARKLAVDLSNNSTDTTFSGAADQTGIKVSGTLPITNGGTGATDATGALYNIMGNVATLSFTFNDDREIPIKNTSVSSTNGVFRWSKLSDVWTYMKGKMSSDTGVNISGNAATATTATNYNTSSGTIKSALDDKVSKVANTTLDNNITTTWLRYGNRKCTISGDNIVFDMSATTGGWAGDLANVRDATKAHSLIGYYGQSGALVHFFIGGTYNDPFLKITAGGIATFKNSLRVPSLSSSDGTYTYTLNSTKGGELALKEDVPAAVSVKGNAETTYRTGQVNLTPANLGISATSTSVTVGSTTFNKYSHPAGNAPSVTGFPAAGGTLSFGGTFDVNQVTTDSTSHVSSITKRTFTLPSLGTTATTAAKGNHTHTASIAADTGTSALTMTANTKYKLTAGGSTFIFTTPVDTTYSSKTAASGGTDVSLVTTGEKWTWNHKQDALTEMTTAEVSALVAAFAS